jgi:hypothetical protein
MDRMVRSATFAQLADSLNSYIVRNHPDKEALRQKWMASKDSWAARAGWSLTSERIGKSPEGLDLTALLERPGEVVARDELVRRLWPEGTFVDFDKSLNAAVTRLRQTLSDSAENPRYIETVARQGYRLLTPMDIPQPIRRQRSMACCNRLADTKALAWLW